MQAINSYTRAQAIADGALIDVSTTAAEAGITFPVALTVAAHADCVAWDRANVAYQDESGRLWDVVWMLRMAIVRGLNGDRLTYSLFRVPNRADAREAVLVSLKAICGPGDAGEPAITLMLPCED